MRTLRSPLTSLVFLIAAVAMLSGCAVVKPYKMEHLADELMDDTKDLIAAKHEMKWLDAREGSTGGVGGAGGGCACK
jgi:hypothetical protein